MKRASYETETFQQLAHVIETENFIWCQGRPRTSPVKTFLPFLIIQPMGTSIFGRSNEGLTLQSYFWLSLHGGNLTFVNLFDTKFSCFTSPPTKRHSFIRN